MNTAKHMKEIIRGQKNGIHSGIWSACTANRYVLETVIESAQANDDIVLIEATANQVNQYGGYTGMTPKTYRDIIYKITEKLRFPKENIILGGDHLGPLVWKHEPSETAMQKAAILIRDYVAAGFTKIHIDTSMYLGDDDPSRRLDASIIAARGARLCSVAETTFRDIEGSIPSVSEPVYVVGSEVPVPGGNREDEGIHITTAEDFKDTVTAYQTAFFQAGLGTAWDRVIACVVQPGVEFGHSMVHDYDRSKARNLVNALQLFPNLVFEGHSTDYQTPQSLRAMVDDGIAILKVGPALTFALREGLFALFGMETELYRNKPKVQCSNFMEVLDNVMIRNVTYWEHFYRGSAEEMHLARKYSYSDRCRYYLPDPEVQHAVDLMMNNLTNANIPISLVSQYMPIQYGKIREGLLRNDPECMLKDQIGECTEDYRQAVL